MVVLWNNFWPSPSSRFDINSLARSMLWRCNSPQRDEKPQDFSDKVQKGSSCIQKDLPNMILMCVCVCIIYILCILYIDMNTYMYKHIYIYIYAYIYIYIYILYDVYPLVIFRSPAKNMLFYLSKMVIFHGRCWASGNWWPTTRNWSVTGPKSMSFTGELGRNGGWNPAGWWFGTWLLFSHILGNNHPNWVIFFRGVETTNQSFFCLCWGMLWHIHTHTAEHWSFHRQHLSLTPIFSWPL